MVQVPDSRKLSPFLWHFFVALWMLLERVALRITVRRQGPVPRGPVLVCAKHAHWMDITALGTRVKRLRGDIPTFQMGSFTGYRLLGPLAPLLVRLGAFRVMRPKEVLRLRHRKGWNRERARERMTGINALAEQSRREILRRGGMIVVFPEGTREIGAVRPLTSEHEIASAVALRAEGVETMVWPAILSYGPRRLFRRRLEIDILAPFPLGDRGPREVLDVLSDLFHDEWKEPHAVGRQA